MELRAHHTVDGRIMHEAAMTDHTKLLEGLVKLGGNVNAEYAGRSLLSTALLYRSMAVVRFLLSCTDNNVMQVSSTRVEHFTSGLITASSRGDDDIVKAFLEILIKRCSAKLSELEPTISEAFAEATFNNHESTANLILKFGSEAGLKAGYVDREFLVAARSHNILAVWKFLAAGADINYRDAGGCTALYHASMGDKLAMVRLLIDEGAEVNAENGTSNTALRAAVRQGYVQTSQLPINNGADVNARDVFRERHGLEGFTLIQEAATRGHDEIVQLFLENGAKL